MGKKEEEKEKEEEEEVKEEAGEKMDEKEKSRRGWEKLRRDRMKEAKVVSTSSSTLSIALVTGQLQPGNYPDPYIYLHVITLHPRRLVESLQN